MEYMLNEKDVEVIKSALNAHTKQCERFLNNGFLTDEEEEKLTLKVKLMKELLDNM